MAGERVTLLLEPTRACNLACRHCYADKSKAVVMPLATAQLAVTRAIDYGVQEGAHVLHIIWHGGEPLLWGYDRFAGMFAYCASRNELEIQQSIQTNGLLLNPQLIQLIRDYRVGLSISLDYPREAHNHFRRLPTGEGTFDKVQNAVELCRREGMSPSVTCVVSRLNADRAADLFRFYNDHALNFTVNPLESSWEKSAEIEGLRVTPGQYGKFLSSLTEVLIADPAAGVNVNSLENLIASVVQSAPVGCFYLENCAGTMFAVGPDGGVRICVRWRGENLGTLAESFTDLIHKPLVSELASRWPILSQSECKDCSWDKICHGGCPMNARSIMSRDIYCPAYKAVRERVCDLLDAQVD